MIILATFLAGWIVSILPIARLLLNTVCGSGEVESFDRSMAMMMAAACGFLWPFFAIWWLISRVFRRPLSGYLTTDHEREQKAAEQARVERVELEQLRRLAREYGLPMPDVQRRPPSP